MTIPLFIWPALCVACLLAVGQWDAWRINRRRDNYRAIEAERIARLNTAPLGNAERVYDRESAT